MEKKKSSNKEFTQKSTAVSKVTSVSSTGFSLDTTNIQSSKKPLITYPIFILK